MRYLFNTEPHADHWSGNTFFDAIVVVHDGVRDRILATGSEEVKQRVQTVMKWNLNRLWDVLTTS